jgi:nucleoside 2-deoxyribosyltransferase
MKIYLAGPLFTTAEREFNAALASALRACGHEVFLPQETEQRSMTAREIFLSDVRGIDWAEAVVANMDGPDPDSGTSWECGYAYGKKPVIVFRTDFRSGAEHEGAPYNLMLTESADRLLGLAFMDTARVAERIGEVLRELTTKP